jgi:hypothetical protein
MSVFRDLRRRLNWRASFLKSSLPRPRRRVPAGARWIHVIKSNSFCIIDAACLCVINRDRYDFGDRLQLAVTVLNALSPQSCVIEDEAIVCHDKGWSVSSRSAGRGARSRIENDIAQTTSRHRLQSALRRRRLDRPSSPQARLRRDVSKRLSSPRSAGRFSGPIGTLRRPP